MSVTNETLEANRKYAAQFKLNHLPMPPGRKIAVLACMDARMTLEEMLGLKTGDAHIIRNAGDIVSEDAGRSLIIPRTCWTSESCAHSSRRLRHADL